MAMHTEVRSKRGRRTRAEWQRLVEAQAASGLTQTAFCRERRLTYSSFCYWRRKLVESVPAARDGKPAGFVEVLSPVTAERWEVELELGEGVYLRLRRS